MNKQEIIQMAREAGFYLSKCDAEVSGFDTQLFEFFALAYERGVRDEREACAKLAASTVCDKHAPTGIIIYGTRVAEAIRARNNKDNQQ